MTDLNQGVMVSNTDRMVTKPLFGDYFTLSTRDLPTRGDRGTPLPDPVPPKFLLFL